MNGIPGWASKDTEFLCPCIREKYDLLLSKMRSMSIETTLLETMRDITRQQYYVSRGVSRTLNSKHLPQQPHSLSLAFDMAITEYLPLRGWWPEGPDWMLLGLSGEHLGLTWGGPGGVHDGFSWDYPHFQLEHCECGKEEKEEDDAQTW